MQRKQRGRSAKNLSLRTRTRSLAARISAAMLLVSAMLPFMNVSVAKAQSAPAPSSTTLTGAWTNFTAVQPPKRFTSAFVNDPATGQTILFGGDDPSTGKPLGDTWVYQNGTWQNMTPSNPADSPSPRSDALMVYDSATKQVVLYGGADSSGTFLTDTWVWDGSKWTNVTPKSPTDSPTSRIGEGMAYDPNLNEVVLFGGEATAQGAGPYYNDTWAWDGTKWTNITPANASDSPSVRADMVMSYDSKLGNIVLFGGFAQTVGFQNYNDTWEWDGADSKWVQLTAQGAAGSPPALSEEGYTYDNATGQFMLLGGWPAGASSQSGDLWTFDGTAWSKSPQSNPWNTGASSMNMTYDSVTKQVQVYDLNKPGIYLYNGQTWSLDTPGPLSYQAMAYDKQTQQLIMFGGMASYGNDQDATWLWTGSGWKNVTPADAVPGTNYPVAKNSARLVYDDATGQLLLYGGDNSGGATWVWDGSKWTLLTPKTTPSITGGSETTFGMTYDPSIQKVVLSGGVYNSTSGNTINQTWTWDGTNWSLLSTKTVPSTVSDFSLAYDSNKDSATYGDVLLFGGYDQSYNTLSDTWAFDGTNWTQLGTNSGPSARTDYGLVDDNQLGRLVLFGGDDTSGNPLNDMWVWNGTSWQSVPTSLFGSTVPTARYGFGTAYDDATNQLVLYGGQGTGYAPDADTWSFSGTVPMVSQVKFGSTSVKAGATANWTVTFTPVSDLAATTGTIILTAPAGTVFPLTAASYTVNGTAVSVTPTQTATNNVTLTVPVAVTGNSMVTVTVQGVKNPTSGSSSPNGFTVSTSSDTMTASAATGLTLIQPSTGGAQGGTTPSPTPKPSPTPPPVHIPFSIVTYYLPNAQAGVTYNPVQLATVSGAGLYQWKIVSGSLPQGLSLSASGLLSGMATGTDGVSRFTVEVTDGRGETALSTLSLMVTGAPVIPQGQPGFVSDATVGQAYSATLTAMGGTLPLSWSLPSNSQGQLPTGLVLSSTGTISGTPTASGEFQFTVQVTDANGLSASQVFSLTVVNPTGGACASNGVLGKNERCIQWQGQHMTVPGLVRNQTTYMPIWYVMQVLKSFGSTSSWDGQHWRLNTERTPDLTNLDGHSGALWLYFNGHLVMRTPDTTAIDPSTGRATTYVPIWYLMQALKRVQITSTWDGTTWTLK